MKLLRLLCLSILVCGLPYSAHANSFHVTVLDPEYYQYTDTGAPLDGTFTNSCPAALNTPGGPPTGCIAIENDTPGFLKSLTISFNDAGLPSGETAACDPSPYFSNPVSCPATPDSDGGFDIVFSGTPGVPVAPAEGSIFLIEETGISVPPACDPNGDNIAACTAPNPFGTITVVAEPTVGAELTPEPSSFVLLGTGALAAGMLFLRKRFSLATLGAAIR